MDEKWKKIILAKLQERNVKQRDTFATLISTQNKLLAYVESYKLQNVQLTVEVERLKQENLELQIKGGNGGSGKTSEKVQALEQKLFKLQEELTELHRKKGENSQQIIDLNNGLQEKEKEVQAKNAKIKELEAEITRLTNLQQDLEQSMSELTTTNQMLTDEQQALQLAFTSLELKFRKMSEDNNDLVARWMELKSRDANQLNKSNEDFIAQKQKKLQHDLVEAANTHVSVSVPEAASVGPAICFNVTIPDHALTKFDGHEGEVNCVRWTPSGKLFATGAADRKVKLWEVINGKCELKGSLTGSNAAIMSVDYDTEENWILGASNDFATRIWSLLDHRLRHTLTGHSGKVLAAKFFGDANKVVSGSHDRTLKIWDLRRIACIKTIFAGSSCNDLVTNDTTNIISGHFDRKIRFWDTRSETSSKEIGLQGRITSLDLAPDRTTLLGCTRDDSIKLIDLRMNQVIGTLSAEGFHVGCDWSRAVFSPDGAYVMAGSNDGALFIWNVASKSVEKVLKEHTHGIIACHWHPNGSSLLSCDKQRKIIFWSDF